MNLPRRLLTALLLAPGIAAAQPARPRGPHGGPNGGQVVVADGHPIELVIAGTELTLFLNGEDGRPSASARASGRVSVQAGGQTATVPLRPAEPNRLVGTLAAPLAGAARVVFTGVLGDGHRATARWALE
jgi:hypothetical protein